MPTFDIHRTNTNTRRQSCNGKSHLNGFSRCSKSFVTFSKKQALFININWLIIKLEGKPNVIACWECRSFTYSSSTFVCQTKTLPKFYMVYYDFQTRCVNSVNAIYSHTMDIWLSQSYRILFYFLSLMCYK